MNTAKWLTLWVLIVLLGVAHAPAVVLDASGNHVWQTVEAGNDTIDGLSGAVGSLLLTGGNIVRR